MGKFVAVQVDDEVMTDSVLHILTMEDRTLPVAVRTFLDMLLDDLHPSGRGEPAKAGFPSHG